MPSVELVVVVPPEQIVASREAPSAEVPSVVPLSAPLVPVEEGVSTSPLFASVSDFPLSILSDFFFALGPWRRPKEQLRPGPLHIDLFFLHESTSGEDPSFWDSHTLPMVRFLF